MFLTLQEQFQNFKMGLKVIKKWTNKMDEATFKLKNERKTPQNCLNLLLIKETIKNTDKLTKKVSYYGRQSEPLM